MAQFKIYFTIFSMGCLVVVWKVSGDPVCYSRQYFDDHNSKISRVDCNSDPKNIYMRFESRKDVTIGALLDGKLRTDQTTSKKVSEATDAVNTPTSKTIKETEGATQTTWTNEMTQEETEEDTSERTILNTVNDGTEENPFERSPKEAVTTTEKQPTTTTAEQLATTTEEQPTTTTEEQPTTTTEEQPTTTTARVTNSQGSYFNQIYGRLTYTSL
ncbi:hypothetical protein HOLleu_41372 [Holothuria leucospilota]|uniref:Uncharacterized protein n=1 Tax=Holothuria leucospilota TaxID=206669 RepID=A0A9Q0YDW4_HOLLE|nr:hypothetical protein HOLleu_41372 [Holothuria leucospilota]